MKIEKKEEKKTRKEWKQSEEIIKREGDRKLGMTKKQEKRQKQKKQKEIRRNKNEKKWREIKKEKKKVKKENKVKTDIK